MKPSQNSDSKAKPTMSASELMQGLYCPPPANTILLRFKDVETAEYIRLVCRRKGIDLAAYIEDNFEWDDPIECLSAFNQSEKITVATCDGCDHIETCPDAVKKKAGRS